MGSFNTVLTIRAPWIGGLEISARWSLASWLSTLTAASVFLRTNVKHSGHCPENNNINK